jgi:hypothetical protein
MGDIALDDVSLSVGRCPALKECTFEDTRICGWTNEKTDDFDWTRQNGATPSGVTGPPNDHTYGTGN